MSNIFNNIVEEAQKQNISVYQLEKDAGLSKGAISKWKTASPTVDNLQSVAKVLKTTVDRLLKQKE